MTAEELLRLGKDAHGELSRGVFHEMTPPGIDHGRFATRLSGELYIFLKSHPLGEVLGEIGVWVERDPDTVRVPDVAFFSAERLPPDVSVTGFAEVVPDLAVEVRSPNDTRPQLERKARMWLSHGVRLVWVAHPDTRTVDVHRPGEPVATLGEGDDLDGGEVLPGFACAVSAVFGA